MNLTTEEIKLLYNFLAHQWVHYDEQELRKVISKLGDYIEMLEIAENEINDEINDNGQ